jgi:hypothetical protein
VVSASPAQRNESVESCGVASTLLIELDDPGDEHAQEAHPEPTQISSAQTKRTWPRLPFLRKAS